MKKINVIGKIIYWLVVAVLLTVAGLTAASALNIPGNYKLFVVLSGSMEPTIKTGSIVIIQPAASYQVGDIITFRNPDSPRDTVTHRISGPGVATDAASFITKGDANNSTDIGDVPLSRVLGKMLFAVPYLGFVVSFTKTQQGLLLLVIIPAVIIIYSEILTIKNETLRLIREKRDKKL